MRTAGVLVLGAAAAGFCALPAVAADLPEEPPVTVIEEPFSWTGPFGGLFGGVASANYDYGATYDANLDGIIDNRASLNEDGGGLFGGVQAGFDYEWNNFVVGAVADIAYSGIENSVSGTIAGVGTASADSELTYLGTVRARLGYAVLERFLVYGHGGFAYAGVDRSISVTGFGRLEETGDTLTGWTVGAGLEYAITDNVSIQTEYGYYDFGKETIYSDPLFGGDRLSVDEDLDFHAVRAGINVRF